MSNSTPRRCAIDLVSGLSFAAQHISQGLPSPSPVLEDGSKVAVKVVYTLCVGYCRELEMKLKKTPKRLKKSSKVEAAKPLSRAPWMPQG